MSREGRSFLPRRRQALIQHFPENGFVFSRERTNYVIHGNWLVASQWSPITERITSASSRRNQSRDNRRCNQGEPSLHGNRIAITFSGRTRKKFPDSACNMTCGVRLCWIAGNELASPLANAFWMSAQVPDTPLSILRKLLGRRVKSSRSNAPGIS